MMMAEQVALLANGLVTDLFEEDSFSSSSI